MQKYLKLVNRVLLGLLMLIPGIMNLFVISSASSFWAWLLVISEVIFGVAIIANYKLKYTVIPPIIILLFATLTIGIGDVSRVFLHLVAILSYLMLAYRE